MSRLVWLTDGAARDLDELYAAAYDRGGPAMADQFLDRIQTLFSALAEEEAPGSSLPELRRLGLHDGRVVRDGPLRVLYRLRDADALLVMIAEQSRSMQSLLQRRMLDS